LTYVRIIVGLFDKIFLPQRIKGSSPAGWYSGEELFQPITGIKKDFP